MTATVATHRGASAWRAISRTAAEVERELDRALAPHRLLAVEHAALDALDSGPLAHVALAAEIGRTRSALGRLVDRLAARKLVKRTPSRADARVVHVELTRAGRAALADAEPTYAAALDTQRDQLAQLVRQLGDTSR